MPTPAVQCLRTAALYFLGAALTTLSITTLLTLIAGDPDALTQTFIALRPIVCECAIAAAAFFVNSLFRTRILRRSPRPFAAAIAFSAPVLAAILAGIFLQQTAVPLTTTFEAFPDVGLNEAEALLLQFLLLPILLPLFLFPAPSAPITTAPDRRHRFLRRASISAFLLLLPAWIFSKVFYVDIRIPTATSTIAFNVSNENIRIYCFSRPFAGFQFHRAYWNPPFKPYSTSFLINFHYSPVAWDISFPLFPLTLTSFLLLLLPQKHKRPAESFPITPLPPTPTPALN